MLSKFLLYFLMEKCYTSGAHAALEICCSCKASFCTRRPHFDILSSVRADILSLVSSLAFAYYIFGNFVCDVGTSAGSNDLMWSRGISAHGYANIDSLPRNSHRETFQPKVISNTLSSRQSSALEYMLQVLFSTENALVIFWSPALMSTLSQLVAATQRSPCSEGHCQLAPMPSLSHLTWLT